MAVVEATKHDLRAEQTRLLTAVKAERERSKAGEQRSAEVA